MSRPSPLGLDVEKSLFWKVKACKVHKMINVSGNILLP